MIALGTAPVLARLAALLAAPNPSAEELRRRLEVKGRALVAFRLSVAADFRKLQGWLSYVTATSVDNIFELAVDAVNGSSFYVDFFHDLSTFGDQISQENWARFRGDKPTRGLADQFKKLEAPYKNTNSIGGYKGAASEILAAIRVAAAHPGSAVRVPTAYKAIDPGKATTPDLSKTALPGAKMLLQDIDRTERSGRDKFYVEVKADAKTADKAHGWNIAKAPQLKRYQEVRETKATAPKDVDRHVAIEITDPGDWVELFLGGTIGLYAQQGFWLFAGGERFSPAAVNVIWGHVKPVREALDKTKFLAPSAFAGGVLPDLTGCFLPHDVVDASAWFELFSTRRVETLVSDRKAAMVGGVWIPAVKLSKIDDHVKPHLQQINPAKFPEPSAFKTRTMPDMVGAHK